MKKPSLLLLVSATLPLLTGTPLHAADGDKKPAPPAEEKGAEAANEFKVLKAESIGKIRHEQKAADLVKIYGEPKSKGKPEMWEAIGEWVEEWKYPALGVTVKMSSEKKDGPKKVLAVSAGKGCELGTAKGIKIGSTRAEVQKAYGDVEEKDSDEAAPDDKSNKAPEEKGFVAGSIYGGVIFSFKGGKVSEIFLGAAAE